MRWILTTITTVLAMAATAAAQPQCSGLVFDKACTTTSTPAVRATFGAPFVPALVVQESAQVPQAPALTGALPAAAGFASPLSVTVVPSSPVIDCGMLKHSPFSGDTKMIHVAAPDGGARVISVPTCANPASSGPKK